MKDHRTRLFVIALAFALVLAALVILAALGRLTEVPELLAGLLTALGILGPAVLDAGAEQHRRTRDSE